MMKCRGLQICESAPDTTPYFWDIQDPKYMELIFFFFGCFLSSQRPLVLTSNFSPRPQVLRPAPVTCSPHRLRLRHVQGGMSNMGKKSRVKRNIWRCVVQFLPIFRRTVILIPFVATLEDFLLPFLGLPFPSRSFFEVFLQPTPAYAFTTAREGHIPTHREKTVPRFGVRPYTRRWMGIRAVRCVQKPAEPIWAKHMWCTRPAPHGPSTSTCATYRFGSCIYLFPKPRPNGYQMNR